MKILPPKLSSEEKSLIKQIMREMIKSTTRLGDKGHEEFDKFLEEEGDDEDFDQLYIAFQMVENIILYEEIEAMPEEIAKLSHYEFLMAKFILLKMVNRRLNKHKKPLLKKIDALLHLKSHNQNLN